MATPSDDLIRRLRSGWLTGAMCHRIADRLAALEAENARLRRSRTDAMRLAAEAMRSQAAQVCQDRADYFGRARARRDWTDAERSYRSTAEEVAGLKVVLPALPAPPTPAPTAGEPGEERT